MPAHLRARPSASPPSQPAPPPAALFPSCDFGDFHLNTSRRTLLRSGKPVTLTPKAFDTLLLLIQHRGQVLDKTQLLDTLWPGTAVEENNLTQNISALRRILGETRGENRYIATIPGRGYCFTAEVSLAASAAALSAQPSIPRIGVLPFANLGAGADRDYLADGLMEDVIATLGQLGADHFSVIGRTSVMVYKHTSRTLAEIGRDLDATYLIESSLRAEGDRFRIASRLIRVYDQSQIWSATYDREPASLLDFQRELSLAIAGQVSLRLSPAQLSAVDHRQTQNPEAYDLYLRGRYHWNQFAPLATRRAIEFFTRATQVDPQYTLAWSGLADALCSSPVSGDTAPLRITSQAREAATRAVAAGPSLAEAQTSLGFFHFWFQWDWPAAETAYRQALVIDSNYAFAHRMLGIVLSHLQQHSEALASVQRARELDPLSAMNHALSAQIAFAARNNTAAVAFAQQAITLDPEFWIGHFQLAQAAAQMGDVDLAHQALNQASRFSGANSKALSLRAWLFAATNQPLAALNILRTLETIADPAPSSRYVPPYALALIHLGLNNTSLALDALAQSLLVRDVHLAFLTIDPKWDALRHHPRFLTLLEHCAFASPKPL